MSSLEARIEARVVPVLSAAGMPLHSRYEEKGTVWEFRGPHDRLAVVHVTFDLAGRHRIDAGGFRSGAFMNARTLAGLPGLFWWVTDADDADAVLAEIARAMETALLPWLLE